MSRIVLGNQRHQVGLTSDYPNMSAIEALVDQRVDTAVDQALQVLDPPWQEMPLSEGWSAYGPGYFTPKIRKIDTLNRVEFFGGVISPGDNPTLFILPDWDWCPSSGLDIPLVSIDGDVRLLHIGPETLAVDFLGGAQEGKTFHIPLTAYSLSA